MRELPILFSAPMVRAILEGRKTVTRRVVKDIPWRPGVNEKFSQARAFSNGGEFRIAGSAEMTTGFRCPHGKPGDRLWVREAWRAPTSLDDRSGGQIAEACLGAGYRNPWCPVQYEADSALNSQKDWREFGTSPGEATPGRYRHAQFMPRWASRITLEVTGVRVERLQDISYEQAIAEGAIDAAPSVDHFQPGEEETGEETARRLRWPQRDFALLWDGLAKPGTRWADNPWVWVVEFRRVEVPRADPA